MGAFSFAGNPLSEEALKATAEFETPLDKNLNSNVPARRIFMHEFVHWLKASGKTNNEIFTALASVIVTKQGTLNEARMNEYRRTLYGGEEMSDFQIIANQSNHVYISTNINKKFIIQLKIIRKQVRFCIFITYLSLYSDNDSHGQNTSCLCGKRLLAKSW